MQTDLFKKSAVLVENNPLQARLYSEILSANGFDVYSTQSAMDGFVKIKDKKQDLMVINTEIAACSFMEKFLYKVNQEKNHLMPIVGISIYSEKKENIRKNLDAFLTKPLSIDKFIEAVCRCIEDKYAKSFGG